MYAVQSSFDVAGQEKIQGVLAPALAGAGVFLAQVGGQSSQVRAHACL